MKKIKSLFFIMIITCILICVVGCGDSSKEQKIVVYDYEKKTEQKFDSSDIQINEFINDISDYLMDEEYTNIEIPKDVIQYKNITLYQLSKNTEENMLEIEILEHKGKFYCVVNFASYPDRIYKAELSNDLVKALNNL